MNELTFWKRYLIWIGKLLITLLLVWFAISEMNESYTSDVIFGYVLLLSIIVWWTRKSYRFTNNLMKKGVNE